MCPTQGHAFIDRQLYLPKAWTDDRARLAAAHVPEEIAFATKPQLAADDDRAGDRAGRAVRLGGGGQRLRRRRDRDGAAPCGQGLRARGHRPRTVQFLGHEPEVAGTAEEIAQALDPAAWQRLSAGAGTKGARLYDWAYCELADLEAAEAIDRLGESLWTRGLLIRRSLADGELAYFTTWCPAGTPIETLVASRGAALGDRGRVRDRQDRARAWRTTRPAPGTAGIATSRW